MAVNAQSFLESVQKKAQKNIPTNKVKRAAVPDLSIFGIPTAGATTAGGTGTQAASITPPVKRTPQMTGANTMAAPIMAAPKCEPQSLFLPQQEALQEQVYPELLVEDGFDTQDASPSEAECSAEIAFLMEQTVRIRQAVDSRRDIAERLENQENEFSTLFQPQYTPKLDLGHFVSNAELSRTVSKQGVLRVAAYIRVSTDSTDQDNSYETQDKYFTSLLQKNPD